MFRDVYPDTWVASDDLSREVETSEKVGKPKDKKVGIFYLMWHNPTHAGNGKIYNHTEAYEQGGEEKLLEVIQDGPLGFAHYWAEPLLGYYRSDDEWVIRKHAYQLANAGVDFIFLDVTNGLSYPDTYEVIFKVFAQIRAEGGKTPDIMFFTGVVPKNSRKVIGELWENLYKPGRYKDLWFMWEGKPLIFSIQEAMDQLPSEILDFFTFRKSWAYTRDDWYKDADGKGCWPWADMYPQAPGKDFNGNIEQAIVMCGFWVNGSYGTNAGRSYHNGKQPDNLTDHDYGFSLVDKTSGLGLAFEEQWSRAFELDPEIVMITGWNEWWAGRWDNYLPDGSNPAEGQRIANTYIVDPKDPVKRNYFVDCFNGEYSRDIEPMKGGYHDNYYYQMVNFIRKFKGAREIPHSTSCTIGSFSDWENVQVEYRDNLNDTVKRDFPSYVGGLRYVNETGRNDISCAKVSDDDQFWYFYVETSKPIIYADDSVWMNLYINADADYSTGWYGYDYLLNRSRDGKTLSVEANKDGSYNWEKKGDAEYFIDGCKMYIKVPKSMISLGNTFDFKWADNSVSDGDITEFTTKGDAAPADRFNFRYIKD